MMMWGYGYAWSMLWMVFWNILWLVLLASLVWALVRGFVRSARTTDFHRPPTSGPSAMEILRQRYARGEIDAATFDQMRERLEASSGRESHPI